MQDIGQTTGGLTGRLGRCAHNSNNRCPHEPAQCRLGPLYSSYTSFTWLANRLWLSLLLLPLLILFERCLIVSPMASPPRDPAGSQSPFSPDQVGPDRYRLLLCPQGSLTCRLWGRQVPRGPSEDAGEAATTNANPSSSIALGSSE